MTGAIRRVRDALEDVQFVLAVLRLRAEGVRQGTVDAALVTHWWARVVELPSILSRALAEVERLAGKRKRRRVLRGFHWRERALQLQFDFEGR